MRVKDVSIICKKMNKEKKWWMIKNRAMNKKQKEIYFSFIKYIKAFERRILVIIIYRIQRLKRGYLGWWGRGLFLERHFSMYTKVMYAPLLHQSV